MAEIETGSLIAGKYRIRRRIGAGGMGAVYEGEHVEIGKRVAIKVIEHEHARSEELAARFRREARAASAVESEHIVQVFDVGRDENVGLYMVMEYLVGEDLASRLENVKGSIPIDEAVTIAVQTARALAKAHAAGVVHRDLKPANLFLAQREDDSISVKILDFGISKLIRPDADGKSSALTREGSVMGTPMYMSPEQAQGLTVDARSDLWSLGSVIYEALAGRTPFDPRDTYEQMIVQIVTQRPHPLAAIAPHVPEAIARVVESTLVHDVNARCPDASTFAKQLAEAARLSNAAPSGSGPTVLAASPPSSARRLAIAAAGGATEASPPTGTGVVVGARPLLDAGVLPKTKPFMLFGAGAAALVVILGVAALATRERGAKPTPVSGLVASTSADPPPTTIATTALPVTSLSPLTPAAAPTATDAGAAPAAARATVAATSRATTRPTTNAAQQPTPTKPAPTQYGAAGVTTEY